MTESVGWLGGGRKKIDDMEGTELLTCWLNVDTEGETG